MAENFEALDHKAYLKELYGKAKGGDKDASLELQHIALGQRPDAEVGRQAREFADQLESSLQVTKG
jgi:hypothetical protein